MSWIAAAMTATAVGGAVWKGVQANQTSQRNKGYINDAYRTAQARMQTQQAQGTEANQESLNQRGLLGAVGPIRAAITSGVGAGTTPGATDLAGASQSNLAGEYALDRKSLDAQHTQDLNENKAARDNAEIGAGIQGIQGIASGVSAAQGVPSPGAGSADVSGIANQPLPGVASPIPSASPMMSPIRSALLTGGSAFGVHPTDPLNDAMSSMHTPHGFTIDGTGMSNSSFNSGGL